MSSVAPSAKPVITSPVKHVHGWRATWWRLLDFPATVKNVADLATLIPVPYHRVLHPMGARITLGHAGNLIQLVTDCERVGIAPTATLHAKQTDAAIPIDDGDDIVIFRQPLIERRGARCFASS